jgi:hypothetical protein
MASKSVQGSERQTGTRDESYNLISALYHLLKGASSCERYIRDAQEAGDQELVQFFKDWQEGQRDFSERAKNLLGGRLLGGKAGVTGGRETSPKRHGDKLGGTVRATSAARSTTNASVNSGGNASDDIVDEESKESFPASDSPSHY